MLARLARADPDERVRIAAVTGLARNGTDAAIGLLVEAMRSNAQLPVRKRAMAELAKIAHLRFRDPPDPADTERWNALCDRLAQTPRIHAALAGASSTEGGTP